MKRRIILSIALCLSIVPAMLISSDSPAAAQNQVKPIADTGLVTLGQNQALRLIVFDDTDGAEGVVFRRLDYAPEACSGGICKHSVVSQSATAPIPLAPNESLQADTAWNTNVSGTRIVVLSRNQKIRANIMIIDTVTGEIVSIICDKATPLI